MPKLLGLFTFIIAINYLVWVGVAALVGMLITLPFSAWGVGGVFYGIYTLVASKPIIHISK